MRAQDSFIMSEASDRTLKQADYNSEDCIKSDEYIDDNNSDGVIDAYKVNFIN